MKKLVFIAICTLLSGFLMAQDRTDSTDQYLISSKRLNLRLQIGLAYEGSFINQSAVSSVGFDAGLLFQKKYYLGLYIQGGSFNNGYKDVLSFDDITGFSDIGIRLGYNIKPYKAVHFSSNIKIGSFWVDKIDSTGMPLLENALTITPSVEIELNLARWLKLGIGAGGRWTNKPTNFFKENKINSLVYGLTLRVGRFAR
jgi:hypothetical protein